MAAIVLLARETGMRLRKAILADLPRLQREAENLGRINIQNGTKGRRSGALAPRWIIANDRVKTALQVARRASPPRSRNLLKPGESDVGFMQQSVRPTRDLLHDFELKGFHELRAAYACDSYMQIAGNSAPVNEKYCCSQSHLIDRAARSQISIELGHNRIDVVSAYIGGIR